MQTVVWSEWFENPFHAIKAIAEANGTPCDFEKAIVSLTEVAAEWQLFDAVTLLDDVLQDVAGATHIVCQQCPHTHQFRAAYDV